jgi:hypothetical protein
MNVAPPPTAHAVKNESTEATQRTSRTSSGAHIAHMFSIHNILFVMRPQHQTKTVHQRNGVIDGSVT